MSQAILVKYLGPTNSRGGRFKATCWSGSKTIPYDAGLNHEGNADAACLALLTKLGWRNTYVVGQFANGDTLYIDAASRKLESPECGK